MLPPGAEREGQPHHVDVHEQLGILSKSYQSNSLLIFDVSKNLNRTLRTLEKLKKRETDLYKYKFKIKDLRKSKHVLTHRAQEMRASLEPKEE